MTYPAIMTAIENELARVEECLAQLRQKVHALIPPSPRTPVRLDAESSAPPTLPVDLTTRGAFQPTGLWIGGSFHRCSTQIEIYLGLLRSIARASPDAMPRTAAALQSLGHKRRYLATERTALFPGQTPEWIRRHSRQIVDGWYADTNLSLAEKQRLVREILRANGLRDGVDVVVLWQRVRVHATGTYPVPVKINV